MGYEDFEDFGMQSLTMLISTLQIMCDIFKNLIWNAPSSSTKRNTKAIEEDNCFEDVDGIKIQTKPIDFSAAESTSNLATELQYFFLLPKKIQFDYQDRTQCTFELFENSFASVKSGYILTTMIGKVLKSKYLILSRHILGLYRILIVLQILSLSFFLDLTVGRIKKQNFPSKYAKENLKLAVERFRRCLNIHPEFGESLSDYDRSLLWKRNILTAGALLACKVTHNRLYRNLIGK